MYCCGPAPVKAVRDRRIDLVYDIPFVYAEVNADVHTMIVRDGRVLKRGKDTERVGSLICTKAIGFPQLQNITRDYKHVQSTKLWSKKKKKKAPKVCMKMHSSCPLIFSTQAQLQR